jgi:hypothetical protein
MSYSRLINFFVLVAFCAVTSTSCTKSFLDVPVTREVITEDYVIDLTSASELLNGTYFLVARDIYDGTVTAYPDVLSDNLKNIGGLMPVQYSWAMIASESDEYSNNMNGLWLDGYNIIRSCNFLIENIDRFRSEDPTVADGIKGQAYALRALVHFNLVNVFAQPYSYSANATHLGIPYDTIYAQTQQMKRQTVSEVYMHVIADLNRATQLIPASANSQSVFNVVAVKAFLSRIYLFEGNFRAANALSLEIASIISMMPSTDYPLKLFTPEDRESLFWLAPATPANSGFTFFQGGYLAQTNYFSATSDLVNAIREHPNDLRNAWFKDTAGIYQVSKFPVNAIAGIINPRIAYYQPVIRASEVLLTAAETYAQLGNSDSAIYYLDLIRKRADNTAPPTIANGSALLDSIYLERRKELCFENMRLFDLLRLKKDIDRKDVNNPAPAKLPFPNNKAVAPIPLTDVRTLGLEQNAGY